MPEEEKLFYTIGEVAQMVDLKPYVLRYWETEFRKLNPQKSTTGQRTYRARDLQVAMTIKRLLYVEKYTIAGAVQKLQELDAQGRLDPLPGQAVPEPPASKGPKIVMEPPHHVGEAVPVPGKGMGQSLESKELKELIERTRQILGKYPLG